MISHDAATVVRLTYDLFNARQNDPDWLDKILLQVDPSCEVVNIPTGEVRHGKEGYKEFLQNWSTALPDSRVEVFNVISTSDQAVVEFTGRGTHTGILRSPKGEIQPTGRKVDLRFCDVYRVRNGQIISMHTYYDSLSLVQQLGLAPG